MIVSPFTPLFFIDRRADGIDSEYVQTFAGTDDIFIELLGEHAWKGVVNIFTEPGHVFLGSVEMQTYSVNSEVCLYFCTLRLSPGYYSIAISGIGTCEVFKVTEDKNELDDTTLIQYSGNTNSQRNDVVFMIAGMRRFFSFRVPGGFKDSNWTFGVDSEQFTNPQSDIVQLYGIESTQKKFTLGTGRGVPVWFGEILNRILVCSHVYFDGVKYVRKESSVPEMSVQLEGMNSFVFTQMLQQSVNLDPRIEDVNRQLILRAATSDNMRITNNENIRVI